VKHSERKGVKGGFEYHQTQLVDFLLFCWCIQYSIINTWALFEYIVDWRKLLHFNWIFSFCVFILASVASM